VKRTDRDEPIGVEINTCMETTQESPYVAIFISNYQKRHVSLFIFYAFSSTKLENRRAEQVLPRGEGRGSALVEGERW
jgi:hypothetical protein